MEDIEAFGQQILAYEAEHFGDTDRDWALTSEKWSILADLLEERLGPEHARTRVARTLTEYTWFYRNNFALRCQVIFGSCFAIQSHHRRIFGGCRPDDRLTVINPRILE